MIISRIIDRIENISITCSIGVLALSIALILSLIFQCERDITLTLIGALGGYIGGGRSSSAINGGNKT